MSFLCCRASSCKVADRGDLPSNFVSDAFQAYTRITIPKNSALYKDSLLNQAGIRDFISRQKRCALYAQGCETFYSAEVEKSIRKSASPLEGRKVEVLDKDSAHGWSSLSNSLTSSSAASRSEVFDDNWMWEIECPLEVGILGGASTHRRSSPSDCLTSSSAASRSEVFDGNWMREIEYSLPVKSLGGASTHRRSSPSDCLTSSSAASEIIIALDSTSEEGSALEGPPLTIEIPIEVFGDDYDIANEVLDRMNRPGDDFSYITKDNVLLIMRIADYLLNERLLYACDEALANMISTLDLNASAETVATFYKIVHSPHFQKIQLEIARESLAKFFGRKLIQVANDGYGCFLKSRLNKYIKNLEKNGVRILEVDFISGAFHIDIDRLVSILEAVPGLTKLCIDCKADRQYQEIVIDKIGKGLEGFANLTTLKLYRCSKLTNGLSKSLTKLSKLEEFALEWCENLTDEFGQYLKTLSNLKRLSLVGSSQLTNQIGKSLKELGNLELLILSHNLNLTEEMIENLRNLPNLTSISFCGCTQLTDEVGNILARYLPKLKKLSLDYCSKLTDKGLEGLEQLPSLEYLNLRECRGLTVETSERLMAMNRLQTLNLAGCKDELCEKVEKSMASFRHLKFLFLDEEKLPELCVGSRKIRVLLSVNGGLATCLDLFRREGDIWLA